MAHHVSHHVSHEPHHDGHQHGIERERSRYSGKSGTALFDTLESTLDACAHSAPQKSQDAREAPAALVGSVDSSGGIRTDSIDLKGAKSKFASIEESKWQRRGRHILYSHLFEQILGLVIFLNMIIVILETDTNARGEETPWWMFITGWVLLLSFSTEIVLKLFVLRRRFWNDRWNIFDFIVIVVDLVLGVLGLFNKDVIDVSALRVLRLSRLARASKILRVFPELQLMVAGLAGAIQAIFWGTVLIVLAVLVSSILAVQFINDLNQQVYEDGGYDGCPRCRSAYDSVFHAAMTFTTQIVAGDSWGRETLPIVEAYPWTLLFFGAVFLSIGLAILNLILGVVVNVATEARDKMQEEIAEDKMIARMESQKNLMKMCREMDADGNDELSKDELKRGFDENRSFRHVLQQLDIDKEDLDIVWSIMDTDHSGIVTSKEFVSQVYKLKQSNMQYMLAYIKYYITEIKENLRLHFSAEMDGVKRDQSERTSRAWDSLKIDPSERNSRALDLQITTAREEKTDNLLTAESIMLNTNGDAKADILSQVNFSSIDILLESALLLAQMQTSWQQCLSPITDMQNRHERLAGELKGITPKQGREDMLVLVKRVWRDGLTSIEDMQNSHTLISKELASIVPLNAPSELVQQLQATCQHCLTSMGDMKSRHTAMSFKIESLLHQVETQMLDTSSVSDI